MIILFKKSYQNIAQIYIEQKRFLEAQDYLEKALKIYLLKFGENHNQSIQTKKLLEHVQQKLNK